MKKLAWTALFLSFSLSASQTQTLLFSGYDALSQGDFRGTMLLEDGSVGLAPKSTLLASDLPAALLGMSIVDNNRVWVSSVGPGSLYEAGRSKSKLVFQSDRPFLSALATFQNGHIAATSAPNGGVYVFTNADDKKPRYWPVAELAFIAGAAAYQNDLYLVGGTKDGGRLLKMSLSSGKIAVLAEITEPLAKSICIATSKAGPQIYFGGSTLGTVYHYNGKKAVAIYAGPNAEVTSLAVDNNQHVFAAFVDGDGQLGTVKSDGAGFDAAMQAWLRPDIRSSQIVRIEEKQAPRVLWQSNDTSVFALFWNDADGHLYAGTGDAGHTLRIDPSRLSKADVLAQSDDSAQVVALAKNKAGQLLSLSANVGTLSAIDLNTKVSQGQYLTPVIDAQSPALFGNIVMNDNRSQGRWRVGNTALPDESWSAFSDKPPIGRYAQAEITLSGKDALSQIRLSYLPLNQKPTIKDVRLIAPNVHLQLQNQPTETQRQITLDENAFKNPENRMSFAPQSNGTFPATASMTGNVRSVYVYAQDPDFDLLRYRFELEHVAENGQVQKKMLLKDWSNEPFVSFDIAQAGAGRFRVAVQTDDFINNGPERKLEDHGASAIFELSSVLPEFKNPSAKSKDGKTAISFGVEAAVPLAMVQCSDAKGDWFLVNAVDGIVDQKKEQFRFEFNGVAPFRSISCQAMDINQNTRKIDIKVWGQ